MSQRFQAIIWANLLWGTGARQAGMTESVLLGGSSWLVLSQGGKPRLGTGKGFARMASRFLVAGPRVHPGLCSSFELLCCPQDISQKKQMWGCSERPHPRTVPHLTIPLAELAVYYFFGFALESLRGCFLNCTDVWSFTLGWLIWNLQAVAWALITFKSPEAFLMYSRSGDLLENMAHF